MAGTVAQMKTLPIAGGASLVTAKLTVSNLGAASTSETFAVDRLKAGDNIVVSAGNVSAGNLAGVGASVTADGVVTLIFDAADPVGDEIFYLMGLASV